MPLYNEHRVQGRDWMSLTVEADACCATCLAAFVLTSQSMLHIRGAAHTAKGHRDGEIQTSLQVCEGAAVVMREL